MAKDAELKARQEAVYRNLVLAEANLVTDKNGWVEVSEEEYLKHKAESETGSMMTGIHLFVVKPIPKEVTDEEFAEAEKSIDPARLADFMKQAVHVSVSENDLDKRAADKEEADKPSGYGLAFSGVIFAIISIVLYFIAQKRVAGSDIVVANVQLTVYSAANLVAAIVCFACAVVINELKKIKR